MRTWASWIADRELWPLAVGVALATFTPRWAVWGLGLIVALWLVRWLGRGRPTVRTPLEWPVGLLLLMIPVTLYVTTDREVTLVQINRLLAGLGLAYGLLNWARRGAHVSLLMLGLTGVGLGLVLLVPFAVRLPDPIRIPSVPASLHERLSALVDDQINANMLAGALVMLLPFPLATLLWGGSASWPSVAGPAPGLVARVLDGRWFRWLWCGAAASSMLVVLLLTQSRGAWVAAGVVLAIVVIRRWPRLAWLILVACVAVGVAWWRGSLPSLLDAVGSGDAVSALERRVEIWSRALYMIQDFPLTGVGVGAFGPVANALYPLFLTGLDAEIPHTHNLLLQVAVDLGIPGLIAFLSILLLALWSAVDSSRFYRRQGHEALATVAWAGLASLVGMLVHGMVDATTWILGRGAFVPWAVIGALIALAGRPEPGVAVVPQRPSRVGGWLRLHPLVAWLLVLAVVGAIGGRVAAVLRMGHPTLSGEARVRLPLYPGAQGASVRTESIPADADWAGPLEIAAFTTTHSITDVVTFYTGALTEADWQADIEDGDATSWGGVYTREEGRSVCLLNIFDIEGETWASVVCGDKTEPVDLPPRSPLPSPMPATTDGSGMKR